MKHGFHKHIIYVTFVILLFLWKMGCGRKSPIPEGNTIGVIYGWVIDSLSGTPISGAIVKSRTLGIDTTDSNGYYRNVFWLSITKMDSLGTEAVGYQNQTKWLAIAPDESIRADFLLVRN